MKRKLVQVGDQQSGLGAPTIMNRGLAARYGAPYVHLAAFAIDLDRAYGHDPDPDARPVGWEVFLTEAYLLGHLRPEREETRVLLEDVCMGILAQPPDAQALGSQLVFAVYDAVRREKLPDSLEPTFDSWRAKPKQLLAGLKRLWAGEDDHLRTLAAACLQIPVEPPMAPPTLAALAAMAKTEPSP